MQHLGTLIQPETLDISGRTLLREAVRGIVRRQQQLLMIFSAKNGDYKFPGGGIEKGESHQEALIREILEECGANATAIKAPYGKMLTYNPASDAGFDIFKMHSYYYLCAVDPDFGRQNLDQYEKALGFTPVWVDLDQAIQTNTTLLKSPHPNLPRWTRRDTYVLEHLKKSHAL